MAFDFNNGRRGNCGCNDHENHENHEHHEHHDDEREEGVLGVSDVENRRHCGGYSRLREECIIAMKVYDSSRSQDCLGSDELGPCRAAECTFIGDEEIQEGDIIVPPSNAASVTVDRLRVKKILVIDKEPSPFRAGYWDVDIKFVFEYRVTFREADGSKIGSLKANSIYNTKISMFGSNGTDLVVATDLFCENGNSTTIDADPFILVEAKAVALSADLKYCRRRHGEHTVEACEVDVTIGLFYTVQLFRIVNLTVESHGFCIPDEDDEISPINACEFFDNLAFPMDVFAPPQKPEFYAGISGDIPRGHKTPCGCHRNR